MAPARPGRDDPGWHRVDDPSAFPFPTIDYPLWAYGLGGLVAGFGTACGSGCTSGHGICGLGRLSPRSLVAVLTFCATAAVSATTTIALVDGGCSGLKIAPLALPADYQSLLLGALAPVALVVALFGFTAAFPTARLLHSLLALAIGLASGVGLVLGGMLNQHKVRGFLNVLGTWDPSLACVMGSGAAISLAAHQAAKARAGPLLADKFSYPVACEFGTDGKRAARLLDTKLLCGSVLFGIGWGALGICPGPSIVGLAGPLVGGEAYVAPWRFPVFVAASLLGMELADATLPASPMPDVPMM